MFALDTASGVDQERQIATKPGVIVVDDMRDELGLRAELPIDRLLHRCHWRFVCNGRWRLGRRFGATYSAIAILEASDRSTGETSEPVAKCHAGRC